LITNHGWYVLNSAQPCSRLMCQKVYSLTLFFSLRVHKTVVRITQALRQQNPGRHAGNSSARGGSALASSPSSPSDSSSPVSLRRETWDSASLTVNTSVAATSPSVHLAGQRASSPSSSSPPSSASPSSTFSLASYLPAAVLEASSGFFGTSNSNNGALPSRMNFAAVAGSTNLAEMEVQSLLLRSMPMFGNLISKE